mmetsp:Transcript_15671/g.36735  ORF Transcript_15671/g.36735 Transcript_15671/m.36735 type:complete len:425 (-) Transcript_15671:152-1426(-)
MMTSMMVLACLLLGLGSEAIAPEATMRREVAASQGKLSASQHAAVHVQADGSWNLMEEESLGDESEEELELELDDDCVELDNATTANKTSNTSNTTSNTSVSGRPDCRRRRSEKDLQPGDQAWPGSMEGRRRCDGWCNQLCQGQGLQCRRRGVLSWRRRSSCWRRRQYSWRRRGTAKGENFSTSQDKPAQPCEYLPWRRRGSSWRRRTGEWRRRSTAIGEPATTRAPTAASAEMTPFCWRRRSAVWRRRSPMWRRRSPCPGNDTVSPTKPPCDPSVRGTPADRAWGSPANTADSVAPAGAVATGPALASALATDEAVDLEISRSEDREIGVISQHHRRDELRPLDGVEDVRRSWSEKEVEANVSRNLSANATGNQSGNVSGTNASGDVSHADSHRRRQGTYEWRRRRNAYLRRRESWRRRRVLR